MKKQQGFIFLMTLIVVAVISLLVLTSMQHILLYHKAINKQEELHQNFYQLEAIALQLSRHAMFGADCVGHKDAANQVMQKLLRREGCSLREGVSDYQYFIEDLGAFPCLVVQKNGLRRASYHRRVSVVRMDEGYPVSLLQVRFITAGAVMKCEAKARVIRSGMSSWRYFASVD